MKTVNKEKRSDRTMSNYFLDDDQLMLADLLLFGIPKDTPIYLWQRYHSIGNQIANVYSGDPATHGRLSRIAQETDVKILSDFLSEHKYIERGPNPGQFYITSLGEDVNSHGGHRKYVALKEEKRVQFRNKINRFFKNSYVQGIIIGMFVGVVMTLLTVWLLVQLSKHNIPH